MIDTLASGGKERRLTELLKALLHKHGVDYGLAMMSHDIHYKEVLDIGINIQYILRKTRRDICVFQRFYKLIRNYKPDIVHCWDSMTAVYASPVCKLLHCKLINGMVIDSPVRQNIFNKYWLRARLTFPFSNVVVGNSQAGLKAYKVPEYKGVVIHPGFNFSRTENLSERQALRVQFDIVTDYVVGMVATFWEKKDYPTFLKAAHLLLGGRKDVTFLVIGTGTDYPKVRELIEKQYMDHFRLLGKRSDIESLINLMDICVLSTFTEGISNSILEYMALGKPVIATRGGGTCEIIADRQTGFLIEPLDADELAGKIEILLNDAELRDKMGSAGRERVRSEFSIDYMVDKYMKLYNELLLN